jgi:5S rRNA maturation endonuclease (ribonuclease M5)
MKGLHHVDDELDNNKHDDGFTILRQMKNDLQNCYHCIMNHSNHQTIAKILEMHDKKIEEKSVISLVEQYGTYTAHIRP